MGRLREKERVGRNFAVPFSAGKTPSLFRHDLLGLHSKQTDRLTISMNAMHKLPSKFVPKKFAMTVKVPNTKATSKCCVGRNPYNGYKYLCGATPMGVFLMQWYDPLNKFMLLKVRTENRSRYECRRRRGRKSKEGKGVRTQGAT